MNTGTTTRGDFNSERDILPTASTASSRRQTAATIKTPTSSASAAPPSRGRHPSYSRGDCLLLLVRVRVRHRLERAM